MPQKILILGNSGFLGRYLQSYLLDKKFIVETLGRDNNSTYFDKEITDKLLINSLKILKPEVIVNAIGETNVDKCEMHPELAMKANIKIPIQLSNAIKSVSNIDPHLIHISTDQVYSGIGLHFENKINPINNYGQSKYSGELALNIIKNCTILSKNFVGKSNSVKKISLSDWIVSSVRNNKIITVFDDVLFNPLYIDHLMDMICKVIDKKIPGTYNLGSQDGITKADFAISLVKRLGLSTNNLRVGSVDDITLDAKRPKDMRMNVNKFKDAFCVTLPSIDNTIEAISYQYLMK